LCYLYHTCQAGLILRLMGTGRINLQGCKAMTENRKPPQAVIDAHKSHKFSANKADYYKSNVDYCKLIETLMDSGFIHYLPRPRLSEDPIWGFLQPGCSYFFSRYTQAVWVDGQIEGFTSILELWKGKPVRMNPGKFIRKLVPYLTDSELESIVADLKRAHSPLDLELIVSNTRESFVDAYQSDYIPKRSPAFSGFRYTLKRLDASCMRGDFDRGGIHPAAAYAGPDLVIVYAKEKGTGKIGARVVAYPDKKTCSYIYTVDDKATQMLCDYLSKDGYIQSGLKGARVSKIEHDDGWLMPYIDNHGYCDDIGEYFKLGYGDIDCQNCSGVIQDRLNLCFCDYCEEHYEEDSVTIINGDCLCEYCLGNFFTYSDLMDEYIPNGDAESNGDGEIATPDWFSYNGYILDFQCIWQLESECVEYNGELYHKSSHYVTCFEGVFYHEDSPELIAAKEAKEEESDAYEAIKTESYDWYLMTETNVYGNLQAIPTMGHTITEERVLRQNYQLNAQGEPERIADFLDLLELTPELAGA
jgi:hypothetical protein